MTEEREYSNIYTIPPNYTDSGKLLGGMLEAVIKPEWPEDFKRIIDIPYRFSDVAPPAGDSQGGSYDHNPAAAGRVCPYGPGRRLAAAVHLPHGAFLGAQAAAPL